MSLFAETKGGSRLRRPTTPIVPSRIRTILLQSNDPQRPGQYVTKATDHYGAVLQCLRSTMVPPRGTILSLMSPDPTYGRVRFICRAIKAVPFALGAVGGLGGEHFAVQWVAIASLTHRSHLENALKVLGVLTPEALSLLTELSDIPELLPKGQELIYSADEGRIMLLDVAQNRFRVSTERLAAAQLPELD